MSGDALTLVDAFQQLLEYATQDADPRVFEPLRKPINDRAAAFRRELVAAEPRQLDAVVALADRAFRRPLSSNEASELRALYRKLRSEEIPHDEAIRLVLARVLVSPAFLYRVESRRPEQKPAPVSDWELASRLSYFLWSSLPDDELRAVAAAGRLHRPDVLAAQARRMAADPRVRRLATEFACQWLHIYDFDSLDEKSTRHFPDIRRAPRRDARRGDPVLHRSVSERRLGALDIRRRSYVLERSPGQALRHPRRHRPEWRRVDGVKKYGRGGILGLAATLAKQSGASRTSPILRGNWVAEVLAGREAAAPAEERPAAPRRRGRHARADDAPARRKAHERPALRQLPLADRRVRLRARGLRRHRPPARQRPGRPADRHRARLRDGTEFDGLDGLRRLPRDNAPRRLGPAILPQVAGLCAGPRNPALRQPLLEEMEQKLRNNGYRFSAILERSSAAGSSGRFAAGTPGHHESRD